MGVGEIVAIGIAVTGAVVALVGTRSERSTNLATVALKLVDPLKDRLTAAEVELAGVQKENLLFRKCLAKHGIDIILDECPDRVVPLLRN